MKQMFRLKASRNGLVVINCSGHPRIKATFETPDGDGEAFREFIAKLKEGDSIIIMKEGGV